LSEHEQVGEQPELLVTKEAGWVAASPSLLADYAWMSDLLGRALRGEIELKSPPEPRHRCLACWLVSLLPRHDRCRHGYLDGDCPCGWE
jgi:hypothetical protein